MRKIIIKIMKSIVIGMFAISLLALFIFNGGVAFISNAINYDEKRRSMTQNIVLNEFLSSELQNKFTLTLLNRRVLVGMGGELYEVYINSNDINNSAGDKSKLTKLIKPEQLIKIVPYNSIEEFYKTNPDCCYTKVVYNQEGCIKQRSETMPHRGYHICVYFRYKLRYLDENGLLRELERKAYSAAMVKENGRIIRWQPFLEVFVG